MPMENVKMESSTPEIGSLTAHSPQESQFVGSSSGVFFINTVRQAFFSSSSGEFPSPEDTLVGSESTVHLHSQGEPPVSQWEYDASVARVLGHAPPLQLARDLMMVYFKVWHPLFPFLHGPTFLHAMESLYSKQSDSVETQTQTQTSNKHNTPWTTIFQCVFHLATLVRPDLQLPPECRIKPPMSASIHSLLGPLTARHDLLSLQALLAAQLYLVATMSLRTASTVGGCMLRSMLHAGLHRCPFRYRELSASASSQHRHLRKRIFWSAYALDRYLSQALGLPLGIQDSDVDVCPPGSPELHRPLQHLPSSAPDYSSTTTTTTTQASPTTLSPAEKDQAKKELPFASYVQSGKLTGEALELFHKSISARSISHTSVLLLTTSVHKWWNSLDLPPPPTPVPNPPPPHPDPKQPQQTVVETPFNYTPFFTILYHHLLLLLNRPALSLPQSTPEFASALQSCISAARHILHALNTQQAANQALFWPGFLSAAWMSGLVLAFACRLGQYVLERGRLEISSTITFLHTMSRQWEAAKHCHRALSLLLRAVSRLDSASTSTTSSTSSSSATTITTTVDQNQNNAQLDSSSKTVFSLGVGSGSGSGLGSTEGSQRQTQTQIQNTHKRRKLDVSAPRPHLHPSSSLTASSTIHSTGPPSDDQAGVGLLAGSTAPTLSIPVGGPATGGDSVGEGLGWNQELDLLDTDMMDLLQGANFDELMDLFGRQYPTF